MDQLLLEKTPQATATIPISESAVVPGGKTKTPRPQKSTSQKLAKHAMHWIRRGHLYFGLFLFPWALLYGVTAFLFNHPTAFSDQESIHFSAASLGEGAKSTIATPEALASEVLEKLNALKKPETPYTLGETAPKFNREFAFVSFKSGDRPYNLLIDVRTLDGTIRAQQPQRPQEKPPEKAPFAVGETFGPGGPGGGPGRGGPGGPRGGDGPGGQRGSGRPRGEPGEVIETKLKEAILAIVPKACESAGLTASDVAITSIPEVVFPIRVGQEEWIASYNPLAGTVGGSRGGEQGPAGELSFRRFLLRLHTAHGYPSSGGVRWAWAVIVDVMAFVMCFWGLSGILMWWQIKSTRAVGFATVALGLLAAAALGVGMHIAMTQ